MNRAAPKALVLASLLAGCYVFSSPGDRATYRGYVGDGKFTDRLGVSDASQVRYEVDFGEIDLSRTGIYVFNFGHLPKARLWIVGMRIVPVVEQPEANLLEPIVRMTVFTQDERLVIQEQAPLRNWAWQREQKVETGRGPAFVFMSGKHEQIPIESTGDYSVVPIEKKADGGWGTYFEPTKSGSYQLIVEVVAPDPMATQYSVKPFIEGSNYQEMW